MDLGRNFGGSFVILWATLLVRRKPNVRILWGFGTIIDLINAIMLNGYKEGEDKESRTGREPLHSVSWISPYMNLIKKKINK